MKVEDRLFGYIEEGAQLLIDSKFDAAIEMFTKADELIEFVADKDMANKVKATCVAAKALALSNSGRKEEAAKLDKEAVDLSRNLHYDNKRTSASSKIFMGLSLAGQGKIDEVIAIADEVLDDLGDDALNLIGVAQLYEYDLDNNYEKAKKALLKARTSLLPRVAESPDLMLDIQYKLANIAQKCEHNDKQAMFEYEKGWRFIEELGVERFSTLYALRIPFFASLLEKETKSISQNLSEAPEKSGVEAFARIFPVTWVHRCNKVFGASLDKGEADRVAVSRYAETNLLMFVESAEFNETVTIERALRCVELSKDILDEVGNARAQCFAGCVLTELGRTKENARKSARLIKPALRVLKKMDDSFAKAVVPVGEGYIANCHFMNEEYDLALEWYESALKGLQSCNDLTRNSFSGYFSMRIVECEMRKR